MTETREILPSILESVTNADIEPFKQFLTTRPHEPMVAAGSGGSRSAADFAALLYGARGGLATAISPYTLYSLSDEALTTSKMLLISLGGHNNDVVFAARRGLAVNPGKTALLSLRGGDRNEADKLFKRGGSSLSFIIPIDCTRDGFVSTGTSLAYFSLLTRVFQPDVDLAKYAVAPERHFRFCRNNGSPIAPEELRPVKNYIILHGSWGRPVAENLEGKMVESGLACAGVSDYRNFCHGRFIFTSNHLEDSAVVLLVSPREKDIAERTRLFLPPSTKLVIIETPYDAPEASLDLLIRATEFFHLACRSCCVDPVSPANPGHIDKRVPMWVPFAAGMKKYGPLTL
ncbi:MAG: hypothetical protein IKU04_05650 [Bacteroidales bacterium]|nr:hypothetical protein [Bacteroidales bacterium]